MKKYLVTLLCAVCVIGAEAKTIEVPKQGLGVQIGWAQPVLRLNRPDNPADKKDSLTNTTALNGFKVGIVYDASYVAGFGSSMGLNYTFGAAATPWAKKNISFSERSQTIYNEVEVFVDWQYKFEVAKETYLMLYTGPTIQCGLGLNTTTFSRSEVTDEVTSVSTRRYETDKADEVLQRLNVTWGVGAGFQYKRYFLRGGYDFGLIPPFKNRDFANGNHARGRLDQWSIKLGIYFWYQE